MVLQGLLPTPLGRLNGPAESRPEMRGGSNCIVRCQQEEPCKSAMSYTTRQSKPAGGRSLKGEATKPRAVHLSERVGLPPQISPHADGVREGPRKQPGGRLGVLFHPMLAV